MSKKRCKRCRKKWCGKRKGFWIVDGKPTFAYGSKKCRDKAVKRRLKGAS